MKLLYICVVLCDNANIGVDFTLIDDICHFFFILADLTLWWNGKKMAVSSLFLADVHVLHANGFFLPRTTATRNPSKQANERHCQTCSCCSAKIQ